MDSACIGEANTVPGPETLAIFIPIIIFMIPIVAILTKHQQKMAELMHGTNHQFQLQGELAQMRQEIGELKALVHRQTLQIDDIKDLTPGPPPITGGS